MLHLESFPLSPQDPHTSRFSAYTSRFVSSYLLIYDTLRSHYCAFYPHPSKRPRALVCAYPQPTSPGLSPARPEPSPSPLWRLGLMFPLTRASQSPTRPRVSEPDPTLHITRCTCISRFQNAFIQRCHEVVSEPAPLEFFCRYWQL